MDRALSTEPIRKLRESVLADVDGNVFEIGFGTGLNLPHYPPEVKRITTIDPNSGARKLAEKRIAESSIQVTHRTMKGEVLPFDSDSFDSVVCTFTLCSVQDVDRVLNEVRRTLKSGGRFHFVEHGLSNDPRVQWWQHKLTPLQRRIGDGCHLDRNISEMILRSGLRIERLENFYLEKVPKFGGYLYRGVAVKP